MTPKRQSADPDFEAEDRASESKAEFVRSLYRGFLAREPIPEEVAYHCHRLRCGETEAHLVTSFADSEEALKLTAQRTARPVTLSESLSVQREVTPLAIRTDDVLRVIAQAMLHNSGSEPSFDEVALKFKEFQDGADLADIVAKNLPTPQIREGRKVLDQIVRLLYAGTLHRIASDGELEGWYNEYNYHGSLPTLITSIADSEEARRFTKPDISPGTLVQMAYEIIFDRGATAYELDLWRQRLEQGTHTVTRTLLQFFNEQMKTLEWLDAGTVKNNPSQAYLFGSRGVVDTKEWDVPPDPKEERLRHDVIGPGSVFSMEKSGGCVVSILTSLYKGGDYIRSFLENITSQSIFRDHCELIIVDACSPDNEGEVIAEFQRKFPNIVYRRCDTRVGIYEAWNIAVKLAKGRYCTNANLDDCRRQDSLEIQAAILDSLPFADVAYQDVLYSFEGKIPFEVIDSHDLRTALPVISSYNLMEFNSPHNAPMWRKSVHDEVGYFNETLKSAGDYDFWMRCLIEGKTFYKSNAAHVGYYVNPEGLSTRPDTRGVEEGWAISRAYYRKIISPLLTAPHDEFLDMIERIAPVGVTTAVSGRRYDILQSALRKLGSDSRIRSARKRA
jgi:glycosyltransferase involved in cell wall biosynthesis